MLLDDLHSRTRTWVLLDDGQRFKPKQRWGWRAKKRRRATCPPSSGWGTAGRWYKQKLDPLSRPPLAFLPYLTPFESWHELRRAFRKCEIVKHLNFTSCEKVNVVHVIVNSWQPDKMSFSPALVSDYQLISNHQVTANDSECCQHQLLSDLSAVFVFIASVSSIHRVNLQAFFITSFLN